MMTNKQSKEIQSICFVTGGMSGGGAERVISRLAVEFNRRKISVFIFCIGRKKSSVAYELPNEVNVVYISRKEQNIILAKITQLLTLRKRIKRLAPDIIISFQDYINVQVLVSLLLIKIPVYISVRIDPHVNLKGSLASLCWLFYRCATGAIFQTYSQMSYFEKWGLKRFIVIYNPCDIYSEITVQNSLNSAELILSHRRRSIISVGRLQTQKNFTLLIKAFAQIAEIFPDVDLYIYGEGKLRSELETLAKILPERIFLPGFITNIAFALKNATAFVMTSNYEGMPNALIEAMCMGCACVSTRFYGGAAEELIEDGVNGILVPQDDEKALADALEKVLCDEELRVKLGIRARLLKEKFNVQSVSEQWLSFMYQ